MSLKLLSIAVHKNRLEHQLKYDIMHKAHLNVINDINLQNGVRCSLQDKNAFHVHKIV